MGFRTVLKNVLQPLRNDFLKHGIVIHEDADGFADRLDPQIQDFQDGLGEDFADWNALPTMALPGQ